VRPARRILRLLPGHLWYARRRACGSRPSTDVPAAAGDQHGGGLPGATRIIQNNGKQKQVRIPAGVKTGSKVRVAGAGPNGTDLYLIISVTEDPRFERRGNDLHTAATVSVFTASWVAKPKWKHWMEGSN